MKVTGTEEEAEARKEFSKARRRARLWAELRYLPRKKLIRQCITPREESVATTVTGEGY